MKKVFALLLAVTLVFAAGCSNKTEQPAPTAAPTVPETAAPETTAPATEPPLPRLEAGTIQGDNIPAILCLLKKDDLVEVTGYAEDGSAIVKIGDAVGTVEKELLRRGLTKAGRPMPGGAPPSTAAISLPASPPKP